jgi:hypothetical protein
MVHHSPDRLAVVFDDERVVATAGLMLPVTLGQRLRPPTPLTSTSWPESSKLIRARL